jgi:hypothetical protein
MALPAGCVPSFDFNFAGGRGGMPDGLAAFFVILVLLAAVALVFDAWRRR